MSSFEPKKERKYFCVSALASKMGQIIQQRQVQQKFIVLFMSLYEGTYLETQRVTHTQNA